MKAKLKLSVNKLIIVGLISIGSSISFAKDLAICRLLSSGGAEVSSTTIKEWENKIDCSTVYQRITNLYFSNGIHYSFSTNFCDDLSSASISIGHASGGGVAFDYHFTSDMDTRPMELMDMQNKIKVICEKIIK